MYVATFFLNHTPWLLFFFTINNSYLCGYYLRAAFISLASLFPSLLSRERLGTRLAVHHIHKTRGKNVVHSLAPAQTLSINHLANGPHQTTGTLMQWWVTYKYLLRWHNCNMDCVELSIVWLVSTADSRTERLRVLLTICNSRHCTTRTSLTQPLLMQAYSVMIHVAG